MLKKEKVEKSFNNYKKWAMEYTYENKLELALDSLNYASQLAHEYYFKLSDNDIESMLSDIGKTIIKKSNLQKSDLTNRFIVYDSIAIDNMALTQQYLRALISWDVEFLYIMDDEKRTIHSKDIISEIKLYRKADIFIVKSNLSKVDKIKIIYKKICQYKPQKAFLHLDTADVVGVALWNSLDIITRYLINHADHAFWIGTSCSDYIISFRSMGINASKIYRNIEMKNLLMQPFYPIVQELPFEGLPNMVKKDSIKLFSGGRYFKIYGENGQFMDMMANILKQNPDTILLFAGSGDERPLKRFIEKHHLEKRWIVMEYRHDLVQVLKNIDIYIGTYPLSGGLMSHYAAFCKKPILERDPMSGIYVEDLLPKLSPSTAVTFNSLDDYYQEAEKLINDKEYRILKGEILSEAIISPEEFNTELKYNIEFNKNKYVVDERNINLDKMCRVAIETENKFLHNYPRMMINNINLRKSILSYVINFIIYIRYNGIKKIMVKSKAIIKRFLKS